MFSSIPKLFDINEKPIGDSKKYKIFGKDGVKKQLRNLKKTF